MKRKKKVQVKKLKIIVTISVAAAVILALIITNFFIPLIYFSAYVHFKTDKNPVGQMRIRYLDVGYGDCTLIELPDGKTILIDGGTGTYGNVYKLLDNLNKSRIDKIDYLLCTSVKSEHCGALAQIVKYKEIGKAYIPQVTNLYITDEYAAFYSALQKSGAEICIAQFGEGEYDPDYGYFFMMLSPTVAESSQSEYYFMNQLPTETNINSASAVLWLQYADKAFMFLSDVTASVQSRLADLIRLEKGEFLLHGNRISFAQCAVLKASNHCAENYTEPQLLDIVQPGACVISVGENAKSCPSNTAIADLQLYVGDNIFRTDLHGTVTVTADKMNYSVSKEKR